MEYSTRGQLVLLELILNRAAHPRRRLAPPAPQFEKEKKWPFQLVSALEQHSPPPMRRHVASLLLLHGVAGLSLRHAAAPRTAPRAAAPSMCGILAVVNSKLSPEALRLQTLAASFQPVFSSTFEECVADAPACVNQIYGKLGLPPRKASVLAARVSSSLKVVRNLDELRATLADIKAGNWTSARRAKHIANVARRGANSAKAQSR